jgi:WD40 repeat protein
MSILMYNIQPLKWGEVDSDFEISSPTLKMKYHNVRNTPYSLDAGYCLIHKFIDKFYLQDFVWDCEFSNDSRYIFSASDDRTVICWDVETGTPQALLGGHRNRFIALATTPRRNYILTACSNETVQVWRYTAKRPGQSRSKISVQDLLAS